MEKPSHKTDIPLGQKTAHNTAAVTNTNPIATPIIKKMNLFSMWCSMEVPLFTISKGSDK